ncbi:hypothetical protein EI94DRAFT_1782329 [Lactarius quietus]|nr:hypothetical protein EI94DRAFT_1782329 [Lactarius quietus]
MFLPLLVLSSYLLLLIDPARAQATAPSCTVVSFSWSYNSLQQNPCLVAAYLAAVCDNATFTIPPLLPGNSYTGPSEAQGDNLCTCNTVFYNLISACDACQGSSWIPYSNWTFNCTSDAKASPGVFPMAIPAGTAIPKWAYFDSSVADSWNVTEAEALGDSPEFTSANDTAQFLGPGGGLVQSTIAQFKGPPSATSASSSSTPTSTSLSSGSSSTPASTSHSSGSSSTPTSTSHSSSNAGRIAAGIVGGLVGVALIVAVMAWPAIRRRSSSRQPVSSPLTVDQPTRIYDPSDPTTFPTFPYTPSSPTNQSS